MRKLASHNSLSYLVPQTWWGKILTPWTKCQDKNIYEQYRAGVRLFDIRIAYDDKLNFYVVHNKVRYKMTRDELRDILGFIRDTKDSEIRVLLDMRTEPKSAYLKESNFVWMMREWECAYNYPIKEAIIFWKWEFVVSNANISTRTIEEYHASVSGKWYEYILGTKWFARHRNEKKRKEWFAEKDDSTETKYLMLDYV